MRSEVPVEVAVPVDCKVVTLRLARGDMLFVYGPGQSCYYVAQELARLRTELVDEQGPFTVDVIAPGRVEIKQLSKAQMAEAGWVRKKGST